MKIDGRTLDHATLEQIRLMAIRRVREGEDPGVVIASYGFNRTTIYKWMHMAAGSGNGLRALSSTRGTGRPRSLTAAQERQVFRWVNGRDPRQYGRLPIGAASPSEPSQSASETQHAFSALFRRIYVCMANSNSASTGA
jgi:transposase